MFLLVQKKKQKKATLLSLHTVASAWLSNRVPTAAKADFSSRTIVPQKASEPVAPHL